MVVESAAPGSSAPAALACLPCVCSCCVRAAAASRTGGCAPAPLPRLLCALAILLDTALLVRQWPTSDARVLLCRRLFRSERGLLGAVLAAVLAWLVVGSSSRGLGTSVLVVLGEDKDGLRAKGCRSSSRPEMLLADDVGAGVLSRVGFGWPLDVSSLDRASSSSSHLHDGADHVQHC